MNAHALLSAVALLVVLAACGSLLVFQWLTGVPPMSSSAAEHADVVALLRHAGVSKDVIYELGAGWGSLAIALARAFPEAQIRGIELSPLPYWVSRLRTRRIPNIHLRRCNFYDCDLSEAKAVTCYLMTSPMPKLAEFLDRSLAVETPVVSISFWFRGRRPSAQLANAGLMGAAALYFWPAHASPHAAMANRLDQAGVGNGP
jgi:hypothetical protein